MGKYIRATDIDRYSTSDESHHSTMNKKKVNKFKYENESGSRERAFMNMRDKRKKK